MCGAPLGGLLVGPLARGAVRRRVALHNELAPARGAALLQHPVLRAASAHSVPRHGQPRDGVVRAAAAARRALRAALLRTTTRFTRLTSPALWREPISESQLQ